MKKLEVIQFNDFMSGEFRQVENMVKQTYTKKSIRKLQKLSTFLWSTSIVMTGKSQAMAAGGGVGLWGEMAQLFSVFQEMAMVLGAIALFGGMITMIFKKTAGKKVVITAAIAVGGCFLVPSAIMLVAIIGSMLNDTLAGVFDNLNTHSVGGKMK